MERRLQPAPAARERRGTAPRPSPSRFTRLGTPPSGTAHTAWSAGQFSRWVPPDRHPLRELGAPASSRHRPSRGGRNRTLPPAGQPNPKGTPPSRPAPAARARSAGFQPASTVERRSKSHPPTCRTAQSKGNAALQTGTRCASSERRLPAGIDRREAVEIAPSHLPDSSFQREHRPPFQTGTRCASSERRLPAGIDRREAVEITLSHLPDSPIQRERRPPDRHPLRESAAEPRYLPLFRCESGLKR